MSYEDRRPITAMQMNVHMFAIADKYEVPDLKTLALEKFKKAACDIHDTENAMATIQRAIYTVFRHVSVPDLEIYDFKIVLATLWTLGGPLFIDGLPEDELTQFIGDVPEWGTFLLRSMMSDLRGDIRQACDRCGQDESVDRMLVTRKRFKCRSCKSLKARGVAYDSSRLVMEPFWESLYS